MVCAVCENVDTVTTEKGVEVFPQTKKNLLCDPAVPLFVMYPKEMKSVWLRDSWASKLTVALSTLAKTWIFPRCLSADEKRGKCAECLRVLLL